VAHWPENPLGRIEVTLADRHDLQTVNEVFCRRDYGSSAHRTVVDIGANVRLATLFFLTRSSHAHASGPSSLTRRGVVSIYPRSRT
jgi:hypothetical protein